jgi:hypothetical protein
MGKDAMPERPRALTHVCHRPAPAAHRMSRDRQG